MFYRLRRSLLLRQFNSAIRGILQTRPTYVQDAPWTIASMVGKSDILMYLLSMKQFYRKMGKGKLQAIIDRDTPTESQNLLRAHFPGIQLLFLEDIDPAPCQRGGTWERLVHVVRNSATEYTIQVDCDTLVVGEDIDEIKACVERNISFAYADNHWPIASLRDIAADARTINSNYVGIVLERSFADWPDADRLKYVRASSGLAGFAKGAAPEGLLEMFHAQMKRSLGERWRDWGTEQSGSNFIVANSPGAITLPFPQYCTFPQSGRNHEAKFFHFIGSNRFKDGYFADEGRRVIKKLIAE